MIFSYIVIFVCVWWIIFYMALPFGNKVTKAPEQGHADSAPTKPRLGIKFIITTIISTILTIIMVRIIEQGYLKYAVEMYINWLSSM